MRWQDKSVQCKPRSCAQGKNPCWAQQCDRAILFPLVTGSFRALAPPSPRTHSTKKTGHQTVAKLRRPADAAKLRRYLTGISRCRRRWSGVMPHRQTARRGRRCLRRPGATRRQGTAIGRLGRATRHLSWKVAADNLRRLCYMKEARIEAF